MATVVKKEERSRSRSPVAATTAVGPGSPRASPLHRLRTGARSLSRSLSRSRSRSYSPRASPLKRSDADVRSRYPTYNGEYQPIAPTQSVAYARRLFPQSNEKEKKTATTTVKQLPIDLEHELSMIALYIPKMYSRVTCPGCRREAFQLVDDEKISKLKHYDLIFRARSPAIQCASKNSLSKNAGSCVLCTDCCDRQQRQQQQPPVKCAYSNVCRSKVTCCQCHGCPGHEHLLKCVTLGCPEGLTTAAVNATAAAAAASSSSSSASAAIAVKKEEVDSDSDSDAAAAGGNSPEY